MKSFAPPPKWLVWSAAVIVIVGSGMTVYGAIRIGVSVDEGFHVVRLRNFLAHGWYLLDDDLAGGDPGPWVTDRWVYAPVSTLLLHALNVVAGNEAVGGVSASASAYAVRHLGTALLGLWGVLATGALARRLMASWQWGLVAAGVLLAIPMWSGHAMFNVKDTPVATGYTLITLACVMLSQALREARSRRLLAGATMVAGLLLTLGTRPGLWPGPLAAMGFVALVSLWPDGKSGARRPWVLADLCAAFAIAMACLAAIYPNVFLRSTQWIAASASESVVAGGSGAGRAYVPLMVMCTVPGLLLVLGATGLLSASLQARRTRSDWSWSVALLLIVLQTTFIPVLVIIKAPPLAGLLRHLLFACPTAAILLTFGIAATLESLTGRFARTAVSGALAVGLFTPMAAQAQLFPYSYSYVSEVVDVLAIDFAPDYWRTSYRELLDAVPEDEFVVCSPAVTSDGLALRRMEPGGQSLLDLGDDCRTARVSVIAPYLLAPRPASFVDDTFISMQQIDPDELPANCTELGRVERRRHLEVQVVSIASRCSLILPDYEGPFELDGSGGGARHLMGGWSGNGGSPWVEAEGLAHLGFAYPGGASQQVIRVTGTADGSVDFSINNEPVQVTVTATGWDLLVDDVPAVGAVDNTVITVVPQRGWARLTRVMMVEAQP